MIHAFIDESGDSGLRLNKEGTRRHFILTSVLVEDKSYDEFNANINDVSQREFNGSEIKSSKIGKSDARRQRVLEGISKCKFKIYCLVVDKKMIIKESGLAYHESFYKYLHRRLDTELIKSYPKLIISSDRHGNEEFMAGFEKYIEAHYTTDLFSGIHFGFSDSKNSLGIQVADLISGTIALQIERKEKGEESHDFMKLLSSHILVIDNWPPEKYSYSSLRYPDISSEQDKKVIEASLRAIELFIKENEDTDINIIKAQVNCIKFLRFNHFYNDANEYVYGDEIINNINSIGVFKIEKEDFIPKIIAPLRDKGIMIISCEKGYKIPSNIQEIYEYVDYVCKKVNPQIMRLGICRDEIKKITLGEVDIFEKKEHEYLKSACGLLRPLSELQ